MGRIVDILIAELENRLGPRDIKVQISDPVRDLIVEKGFDPQLGARPLRRAIQKLHRGSAGGGNPARQDHGQLHAQGGPQGRPADLHPRASTKAPEAKKEEKEPAAEDEVKEE